MAVKLSRSARQQQVREAQRRWLDQVVLSTGLTLTEIARRGQLTPTTLTRFRNNETRAGTLAVHTISTVSEVTGVGVPPDVVGDAASKMPGLREPEAEPYQSDDESEADLDALVKAYIGERFHLQAWRLKSRALDYAGYRSGDVLLVDLNAQPSPNDIVCVQVYDIERGAAETVFRLYKPPVLVAAGPNEASGETFLLNDRTILVKGVVLTSMRGRGGRVA